MQVRLLGPVDVLVEGVARPVSGLRRTAVLAALALHPGQIISADRLVDAVWGDTPPPTAVNTVQSHVSHLRQILGSKAAIRARPPGYLLDLGAGATDVQTAERLIRHGTGSADHAHRGQHLQAALALWRGQPLANLAGLAWVDEHVERLNRLWLQATRALIETRLALGEHAALLPELEQLIYDHPFDEQLHGQLMLALYRSGRQADALAAYRRLRHSLRDDLGIYPGQVVRDLHAAMLRQDSALDLSPQAVRLGPIRLAAPPAQLPSAVPGFTGRATELATLDAALAGAARDGWGRPASAVISLLSGTAGVGKTALAVHWAHRVADRFPDGQLYVNLRGYDPDRPVTAADALVGFLGALGVGGQDIPLELADRAARYRTETAGRRILVVLDNAGTVEQVRPLLPGSPTAMVVVTSRDSLAGLVALHGAGRLELDLLPAADALALLRELVGRRVDAEPGAAAALAAHCARLPLALRVAAELAASRPTTPLSDLVAELADRQRRLDLLDVGGDPHAAVTAVFSWSYRHLPPDAARAFRLTGLHPGPDTDAYAAAALADTSLDQAHRTLDLLIRSHLAQPSGSGRYGMHDLLRAYATGLATTQDTEPQRRAALGRLFDYYLATAAAAMDRLHPAEAHRRPRIPPRATPTPALADPDTALAWLDVERPTLVAVAAHTANHGWPAHAVLLAATLFRYLVGGHYIDALAVYSHARDAARKSGDRAGEAQALHGLGTAHLRLGRHEQAADLLQQALILFRQTGDPIGQARALGNLGTVEQRLGRYQPAADHYRQALGLYRQARDQVGEASVLDNLGSFEERLGNYGPAAEHHQRALTLFRQAGDRTGEAQALNNLGDIETRLGRHGAAAEHHRQALTLYRQTGDRTGEAWVLTGLGELHTRLGRLVQATEEHHLALTLFRELGDGDGEPWALNGLGEAAYAAGRPADALGHHTAALAAARNIGIPDQQARAHAGLAQAHHALGDRTQARDHLRHARALYTEIGIPEPGRDQAVGT